MFFAASLPLANYLSELYSIILSETIVPKIFERGIIIPILKKTTLDPNMANNFRPVTISSTHTKILELAIMPNDTAIDTQFGFRKGRGTSFVTTLVNDVATYMNYKDSPMFVCSLDAEKCFDSIWHDGLFFKLWNKIPSKHWLFLLMWYKSSSAQVRWESHLSSSFLISKGMKQGSLLSPRLFNMFLNDLLVTLKYSGNGIN